MQKSDDPDLSETSPSSQDKKRMMMFFAVIAIKKELSFLINSYLLMGHKSGLFLWHRNKKVLEPLL